MSAVMQVYVEELEGWADETVTRGGGLTNFYKMEHFVGSFRAGDCWAYALRDRVPASWTADEERERETELEVRFRSGKVVVLGGNWRDPTRAKFPAEREWFEREVGVGADDVIVATRVFVR